MSQAGKAHIQAIVDRELRALGAESETARQVKRVQKTIENYTFDEEVK